MQSVSGERSQTTRSNPGLLEILLPYDGTVDVAMARARTGVTLRARWLDLEIAMGNEGGKMNSAIQIINRIVPYDEGIDVLIHDSATRFLSGGVVFLSGDPGNWGVVYVAADPRPFLTLIPAAAQKWPGS